MPDEPSVFRQGHRDSTVHCTIGAFGVTLRSELEQVLQDFASVYPSAKADDLARQETIRIEVVRSGRSRIGRRLYRVYADGEEVGGLQRCDQVFPLVEWGINLRIIARRSEYLQFHAASVAFQGDGVIFPGDSGRGKSTLAALLMTRGWQYFCDEFALVARSSLNLHAFPKALCIKAGSYPIVRRLGLRFARRRDYIKQSKGRVGYVNPRDVGPDAVAEPTAVRYVIFPTYTGGTSPRLHPIPRAEAAIALFRCCFNRHAVGDDTLPIIQRLVSGASCFRLDVGDPDATGALLEATLNNSLGGVVAHPAAPGPLTSRPDAGRRRIPSLTTRRDMLRVGAKLAYVAPSVLTLSAHQVFAAGSNPSDICSTGVHTGGLCETDTDCCSRRCSLGVCTSNQ